MRERQRLTEHNSGKKLLECRKQNAEQQRKVQLKRQQTVKGLGGCMVKQALFVGRQDLGTFNEDTVPYHDIGQMNNQCSECGALMFKDE